MSNSQSPHHSSRKSRSKQLLQELDQEAENISQTEEFLVTMVEKFQDHYTRVSSVADADLVTTDEIFASFQEFYPGNYTVDLIVNLLSGQFIYEWSPDLKKFVWLIKQKT